MLTVVMTDIHGCYNQMLELIEKVNTWNDEPKQFIFLGDYVDRGPDSAKVVQYMIDHPEHICFQGNHEDMMIAWSEGQDMGAMWLPNGGIKTLDSYSINNKNKITSQFAEHVEWMKKLPLYHQDDQRIYVHAGLRPGVSLDEQKAIDMLWIRDEFLSSTCNFGKLVIHGHTPHKKIDIQPNRINLDTGGVFGGKFTAALFDDENRFPSKFLEVYGHQKHVLPEDILKAHPDQ